MQVADMRAMRTLYSQKHFFEIISPRADSSLPSLISCKYRSNPKCSRHFGCTPHGTIHHTSQLQDKESAAVDVSAGWSNRLNTWSTYNSSRNKSSLCVHTSCESEPSADAANRTTLSSLGREDVSRDVSSGVVEKLNSDGRPVQSIALDEIVGNRKKKKSKTTWVCADCGYSDGQWWGMCRSCKSAGTMKQFSVGEHDAGKSSDIEVSHKVARTWLPKQTAEAVPLRLTDVNRGISELDWRIPLSGLFGAEVARVLGGGIVPGSLILVGGDPGVGKSTLLLQIAAIVAEGHELREGAPVVYVSGEESIEQIGSRADRLKIGTEELYLYSSTDIEDILEKAQLLCPRALIVDSIQTVYLNGVTGSAGGLSQVRECTSALLRFAKKTNIPVLLIGHLTKTGEIAGPRVLEHIVDVVLYMEGEKCSSHRLLRSVKNRFGSTDEVVEASNGDILFVGGNTAATSGSFVYGHNLQLGVFEMSQSGLQSVSNPSEIFLSDQPPDSEFLAGLAVAVIMDGSRSFLIEIQALCVVGSSVSRQVNGIQASRADMIISVLMKQAGLKLQENGIFLNVVSGVTLTETAGDLAIAAAICSSFLEFPIPNGVAFIGEIGLGGELRAVPRMEKRVYTVAKLGYKVCVVPKSVEKALTALALGEIEIVGCRNLKEMINLAFKIS